MSFEILGWINFEGKGGQESNRQVSGEILDALVLLILSDSVVLSAPVKGLVILTVSTLIFVSL